MGSAGSLAQGLWAGSASLLSFCTSYSWCVFLLHLNMITTNTTMSWRLTILHPLSWEDPLSWVILLCWSSITLTTVTTMITIMTEGQRWSFTIHPLSLSSVELCSHVAGNAGSCEGRDDACLGTESTTVCGYRVAVNVLAKLIYLLPFLKYKLGKQK